MFGSLFSNFADFSFYIFFSLILVLLLKSVSISYSDCRVNRKYCFGSNENLYFFVSVFLLILLMFVPSFRFFRHDSNEIIPENLSHFGGTDTPEYKRLYDVAKGLSYFDALEALNKEFIFVFIFWIFSNLNIPFQLCLCLFNFFMFLGLLNFCKIFDLKKISFVPVLCMVLLYFGSFNTLRWSVTLLLASYLSKYIIEEKKVGCILISVFAVGIQEASLVFFMPIFGFWITRNLTRKKLCVLYFLFLIFICYIPSLILDFSFFKNNRHYVQILGGGQIPITWIGLYVIFIINHLFINRNYLKNDKNRKLFYLILFLMPPTVLEFSFFLAYRFSYYAHPIFYMYLIDLMESNRKKGIVGISCNLSYLFLLLVIVSKYFTVGGLITESGLPFVWGNFY